MEKKIHGFLQCLAGKKSACNAADARDTGLIPGLGRSSWEGNDYPPQYPCLENFLDRGAWWATVYWVANGLGPKSQTERMTNTFTSWKESHLNGLPIKDFFLLLHLAISGLVCHMEALSSGSIFGKH